jgi:hypothetical protein
MFGAAAIACSGGASSPNNVSDASSRDVSSTDSSPADVSRADAPPADAASDAPTSDAPVADATVDGGPCLLDVPDGDVCKTVCVLEGLDGALVSEPCQTYCSLTTDQCFLADGQPNYNCDYSGGSDGGGEVFC